ncbi:hypothetical protein JCM19379_25990 [Methyloparacoccus murrellii]
MSLSVMAVLMVMAWLSAVVGRSGNPAGIVCGMPVASAVETMAANRGSVSARSPGPLGVLPAPLLMSVGKGFLIISKWERLAIFDEQS